MTFLELQQLTSYWLDDLNFGYFTQTQVKRWLNNAQQEAQKILIQSSENWFLDCVTTTCVANQPNYALPDDFLKLNRLQVVENPGTSSEDRTQIFGVVLSQDKLLTQSPAFPAAYYLKSNQLILVPVPDSTYTLRMDYTFRLADMVLDGDVSDIPEQYHEYIALLAAISGFLKDDRNPSSLLAKKQWYEELFKRDSEDRKVDAPREVISTKDDYFMYGQF